MKVDVAVIPAAGRGTRMRPATRVVPKALLTVVDRPAIQYAVEEAARAGASEAILVVDLDAGHLIHQHFVAGGRLPGLEDIRIRPVVQEEPLGLGHAVWEAREMVDNRPFFVILADDIVPPGHDPLPELAERASPGTSVMCLRELPEEVIPSKGVVVPASEIVDSSLELAGAVEKPALEDAPSNLGLIGRYLFDPAVFDLLESLKPGHGGEVQLTDAIQELGAQGKLRGYVADADLLDIGNPAGLLNASIVLGLERYGDEFRRRVEAVLGS